jgi:acetyl esterase/lipase
MAFRFLVVLMFVGLVAGAQQKVIPLYNGPAPGSEKWTWEGKEDSNNMFHAPVAYNISKPTLTVFPADPLTSNGTAVIICPGGAFHTLSVESEGSQVAEWLNKKGVTAFVLRYRVVKSLTDDPVKELMGKMGDFKKLDEENDSVVTMAIADGKRAIEFVRTHAGEYKINPKRIGIMGFSAGGTLTMGVGYHYSPENRPDFLAPVYLYKYALGNPEVPGDAPPIFICAASDDQLGFASHSSNLYNQWLASGKSAELHMYLKGGHGFGMRKQNLPVDSWIERFGDWLALQGLLSPEKQQ